MGTSRSARELQPEPPARRHMGPCLDVYAVCTCAPYATPFGPYVALIFDPDGTMILLSA